MSDDLIAFLRARYDEDEQVARESDPGPWEVGPNFGGRDNRVYIQEMGEPGIDTIGTCVIAGQVANKTRFRQNAVHIARWDPARVLAEVEAKRRMLDYLVRLVDIAVDADLWNLDYEQPFKLMALPYDQHPDYRPEWRPDAE